jgi:uncharacterized protein YjbJ (UPF0337 family)
MNRDQAKGHMKDMAGKAQKAVGDAKSVARKKNRDH